jgi:tRNA uridine 5-carboxymethylaminomethyl modification enzyme
VDEPYRMFTSRSEFRLLLRIDNADRRLSPLGYELGLLSEEEHARFRSKYDEVERMRRFLREHRWNPEESAGSLTAKLDATSVRGATLEQLLRRPEVSLPDLAPVLEKHDCWPPLSIRRAVEIEVRYEGYIQQQARDAEKLQRMSARRIPPDFDYAKIDGLSREIREKLARVQPRDLAMAGRIPGVTPAAVSILNIQLEMRRGRQRQDASNNNSVG